MYYSSVTYTTQSTIFFAHQSVRLCDRAGALFAMLCERVFAQELYISSDCTIAIVVVYDGYKKSDISTYVSIPSQANLRPAGPEQKLKFTSQLSNFVLDFTTSSRIDRRTHIKKNRDSFSDHMVAGWERLKAS